MNVACRTCIFWNAAVDDSHGECHRRAPHGLPHPSSQRPHDGVVLAWDLRTEWPHTHETDFCGDHAFGDVRSAPEQR